MTRSTRCGASCWPESVQLRGYYFFSIRDPKPRRIAAPAFRDRALHHAILRVVGPELERVAIHDSYACRVGKGLHRAVARAWAYALRRDYRKGLPQGGVPRGPR